MVAARRWLRRLGWGLAILLPGAVFLATRELSQSPLLPRRQAGNFLLFAALIPLPCALYLEYASRLRLRRSATLPERLFYLFAGLAALAGALFLTGQARIEPFGRNEFLRLALGFDGLLPLAVLLYDRLRRRFAGRRGKIRGYVYVMRGAQGHKIGRSRRPESRLRQLRAGDPTIKLVHCIPTDNPKKLERELHKRFAAKRRFDKHEWFDLDKSDLRYLRRL